MYSFLGRGNYVLYNAMIALFVCGTVNHIMVRWGHLLGVRDGPVTIPVEDIKFEIKEVNSFMNDKYYNEEALTFSFDMKIDLAPIMTWNTHTIFARLICVYETASSKENSITVWDQRIPRTDTEHWIIDVKNEFVEYYLTDINKEMKDTKVTVYFKGENMSTIGTYYGDMIEVGSFVAPGKYMGSTKRASRIGPSNRVENY